MIIIECEQGGIDWHAARSGVITASMFRVARSKVNCLTEQQALYVKAVRGGAPQKDAAELAGYKAIPKSDIISRALDGEVVGEFSDAAKDYAFRLAIERISGAPLDEGFETYAMRRGHELEPEARMEHEIQTGLLVERAGFVLTDDRVFGGSADGLIEDDGGSEYKCLISPEELRKVLIENDFSKYVDQVQGCLWLTGRKWWDFCMYCPALRSIGKQLWYRRVSRDDNYIEAMEVDLLEFKSLVDVHEQELRKDSITPTATEVIMPIEPTPEEADRILKEKQDAFDAQMREEREQAAIAARRTAVLESAQQTREADAVKPEDNYEPALPLADVLHAAAPTEIAKAMTAPTLKLGEINARIAPMSISADGLRQLGFEPAGRERSAILYFESDWPAMRKAMADHIGHASEPQRHAA